MLSAAVAGDIFASPSAASVLAAIMTVTGTLGCLVIIKNYTGDRLNFGLACAQARAAGVKVEMVVVGDDCALPARENEPSRRRGLAGTVLVHKVAGAAAAAGLPLQAVAEEARQAAAAVGTMGLSLSSCTLPGQTAQERIPAGQVEIGLGIHGARRIPARTRHAH
jgi:dihydroxyacetone kinase